MSKQGRCSSFASPAECMAGCATSAAVQADPAIVLPAAPKVMMCSAGLEIVVGWQGQGRSAAELTALNLDKSPLIRDCIASSLQGKPQELVAELQVPYRLVFGPAS